MTRTLIAALLAGVTLTALAQSTDREKFSQWSVDCRIDAMTDAKTCLIHSSPVRLVVAVKNGNLEAIMVGGRHDPGSNVMIRLDSNQPLSAREPGFRGHAAAMIIESIPKAKRILTRHTEWPSKQVDGEFSTEGFADAFEFAVERSKISKQQ